MSDGVVFFFQAEDGIRDIGVTGVQTCALPIFTMVFLGMFAVITPALISGAVADRMKFSAWAIFVPAWLLLVYCPVSFWIYGGVWGDGLTGWLGERGSLDFAGGTVDRKSVG